MGSDEFEKQKTDGRRFYIGDADDSGWRTQWPLIDRRTGEIVATDGGEPEDQLLLRDWQWVPDKLNALDADAERWKAIASRLAEAVDAALDCTDAEPAHLCVTCRAQLRVVLAEHDAASGKTGGGSET